MGEQWVEIDLETGETKRRSGGGRVTDTELAYAAGILDGEGCIEVCQRSDKMGYRLGVTVVNTSFPLLNWLQTRWGGSIHTDKPDMRNTQRRPCGRWVIGALNALEFLQDVQPYLLVKRDQAENAIAFQLGNGRGAKKLNHGANFAVEARRLKVV